MQEPAISGIQKGGNYGFDPVFRGFKYDQLNVVLDGAQGAMAACPNRMDPPTSQMAPNMMDRIEILKGPHALRFGTGFGATLNFVPAKLRFSESAAVYARMSNGFETNGEVFRNEGRLGVRSENQDLSLFGSWSQGNDYTAGNGQIIQSDFNRGSFGGQFGFKLSESDQLRLSAIYNITRDADFPALAMDLRKDDTWLINARYDKSFTREHLSSWNTTVFGSFVNHRMDNLLKPLDPRTINAETEATTYNFGWRSEGVWNFKANTLYLGTDFRKEGAEGIRIREFLMGPNQGMVAQDNAWQDGAISKTGMFAEYQLRGQVWKYVLSSRVELNASDVGDPASEFTAQYATTSQTQLNPSISLGAQRNTENGARYGIWLARAQRSAGLAERYINFLPIGQDPYELLGNPELKPEINYQLDLTYDWTQKNTQIGVDAFVSSLHNFISSVIDPTLTPRLPMSPGVRRFVNIDNAFKTGVEFSWTQRLLPQLQQQISLAYTYAQDLEREQPLPEIAPLDLRYTLSGSFMEGKLKPELVFRHVLRQNRIAAEYGETETPSFSLLNLQTTYVSSKKTRFTLGINNLLDTNYYEHLNRSVSGSINPIYAPGRNVFASVNFTL